MMVVVVVMVMMMVMMIVMMMMMMMMIVMNDDDNEDNLCSLCMSPGDPSSSLAPIDQGSLEHCKVHPRCITTR